jgi:prepilin-type processing-associated H-X9-DG protein
VPGIDVSRADEKLFFILDYPLRVADYTDGGEDRSDWNSYFFTSTDGWAPPSGYPAANWMQCQALRHFNKANVLFMDGHIETLPGVGGTTGNTENNDVYYGRCLEPQSAYWQYGRPHPVLPN